MNGERHRHPERAAPPVRGLRAAVIACFTVVIACGCHTAGGGMMPSPGALLVASGALTPVCWYACGRRWRVHELVAVLLVTQVALHLWCLYETAMPMGNGYPGGLMLLAHLVATAAGVALIRGADGALWLLSELSLPLTTLGRVLCYARPVEPASIVLLPRRAPRPRRAPTLCAYGVRGPPSVH